jgi:hypothetical protein
MKLIDGFVEIMPGKWVLTPGPVTWLDVARLRFGPLLAVAAVGAQVGGQIMQGQAAAAEGKSQENIAKYSQNDRTAYPRPAIGTGQRSGAADGNPESRAWSIRGDHNQRKPLADSGNPGQ